MSGLSSLYIGIIFVKWLSRLPRECLPCGFFKSQLCGVEMIVMTQEYERNSFPKKSSQVKVISRKHRRTQEKLQCGSGTQEQVQYLTRHRNYVPASPSSMTISVRYGLKRLMTFPGKCRWNLIFTYGFTKTHI